MALVDKNQQTTNAQVLRDETQPEANTRARVYQLLKDLIDSGVFYDQVKQITGNSTTDVMSQKAVSDALTALTSTLDNVLTAGNDAGAKQIKNLANPTAAQDADTVASRDAAIANLATQLIGGAGAGDDTLKKLADKIAAINAIIGGTAPDGDSLVNTVAELLAVFANYSEGADIVTLLSGKVNTGDVYNALDQIVAGKVLDARQGKVLKDLVDTKQNALGFIPENVANKGVANGYASLGVDGKVPASQLPIDSSKWNLANGGLLTGINTITSNAANQLVFNGTWTATTNNQYHSLFSPIITLRSIASDVAIANSFTPSLNVTSTLQNPIGLNLEANFIQTGPITSTSVYSNFGSVSGMTPGTYTNVAPASTSGTGTGALFTVVVGSATIITSIAVTTAGTGYRVNDSVTFNGSQFGAGSGSASWLVRTVSGISLGSQAGVLNLGIRGVNSELNPKLINFYYEGVKGASFGFQGGLNRFSFFDSSDNLIWQITPGNFLIAGGFLGGTTNTFSGPTTFQSTGNVTSVVQVSGSQTAGSAINVNGNYGGFFQSNSFASRYKTTSTTTLVGVISAISLTTGGTGYTTGLKSTTGGTGTGASINVVTVSGGVITSVSFSSTTGGGGSNYSVGDVLTLSGGTGGTVTVTAVDYAGNIVSFDDNNTLTDARSNNIYTSFLGRPTVNITSSQSGAVRGFYWNPTITSLGSFQHIAIHAVTGSIVLGHTTLSASTTRLQVRGISGGLIQLLEDHTGVHRFGVSNVGNIYGTAGSNSMTDGFIYIPSAAGAPSGVPTAIAGRTPLYFDETNDQLYVYRGSWKKVTLT